MTWGLGVGILVVMFLFVLFAFVIFKETRTHRFWQSKVEEGDLEMITQLVQLEVDGWRTERPPKGTPAAVWQGIQGVELAEVGRDYIRASSTAEPQFALVGGERRQVSSALDEARRITARLAERFFYDIPHVRLERVQIDIYTTFHELGGQAMQRCILTTVAGRDAAAEIDWDDDAPEVIAERLGAHYQLDSRGTAQPIEPEEGAVRTAVDESRRNGAPQEPNV
ncbi:MAG: hypothetical protein U1B78_03710 [Dehalococcoidia bacterium]|nr:hypothetical protein [Dehalococcoidia bacterium]